MLGITSPMKPYRKHRFKFQDIGPVNFLCFTKEQIFYKNTEKRKRISGRWLTKCQFTMSKTISLCRFSFLVVTHWDETLFHLPLSIDLIWVWGIYLAPDYYPFVFRVLSRLCLWSSSAITAGSCFFLSFVIVFAVIEPILSKATCNGTLLTIYHGQF